MKIICVGNRYVHPDGAALWLYDGAVQRSWPAGVEWIEGGLGGLNLAPHFEHGDPVVVVDYMPGQYNGQTTRLSQVLDSFPSCYDHASAFYYLLRSLPNLYTEVPAIALVACDPQQEGWERQVLHSIEQVIRDGLETA